MSVALPSFLIFAAAQVATPGPANMVLLATGARFGVARAWRFVAGVALGKQLIIWPIGFGLMEVAVAYPLVFGALKYLSAAYILWLAWRIAHLRLTPDPSQAPTQAPGQAPGFLAGLIVHPLNPKAWGVVTASFTNFVAPGTATLEATALIAAGLLLWQALLHPLWALAGAGIAARVAGTPGEVWLMRGLAGLTVLSVALVLFSGGGA